MTKNNMDLTKGDIGKSLIIFSIPIFLSNLFQQLYNMVDAYVCGNYIGDSALAAVGSSASLILLLVGFFQGLSMGAGVVIARFYGAKDQENLVLSVKTTIIIGFLSSIILTIVGVFFTPKILVLMGTPKNVLPESIKYFKVYFWGITALVMYNIFSSILRAIGDSESPMNYLFIASLTNVILDFVFIKYMHKGVDYAALATVISQTLSAILSYYKLKYTLKDVDLKFKNFSQYKTMIKDILNQGIPSGMQLSLISVANVIVQSKINSFGKYAMAGCGSSARVEGFAFLPITCFSLSIATFISQNIGAREYERAKKGMVFSIILTLVMSEAIGIVTFIFREELVSIFTSSDLSIYFGAKHLKTISLFYFLLAYSHIMSGILRGIEKPMLSMIIMFLVWCVLRIIYINIALKFSNEILVVFMAYPLTWFISSALFTYYVFKEILVKKSMEKNYK